MTTYARCCAKCRRMLNWTRLNSSQALKLSVNLATSLALSTETVKLKRMITNTLLLQATYYRRSTIT